MIRVQSQSFDPGAELNTFTAGVVGAGAIVSFTGIVRDVAAGLEVMQIEHYPGMTERALDEVHRYALDRWNLAGVLIIHRYGELAPADVIMMVAAASAHRKDAFEAADFLMDYLKSRAPFWKKELTRGGANWVEAQAADEDALKRW